MKKILILPVLALAVLGCATQRHGRAVSVSELEARQLDCSGLAIEIDKNRAFFADINQTREQGTVMNIFITAAIGNHNEYVAAIQSGKERDAQLLALAKAKSCNGLTTSIPPAKQATPTYTKQ